MLWWIHLFLGFRFLFSSPLFHFSNVFFLQWQFSILSPCAPIYLATVNISDKVHIPLCISHSPFYSLFILHCVWRHAGSITISSFIPPHLFCVDFTIFSLSVFYALLFMFSVLVTGLALLSWGFSNSHFFFVFNPSSYLFQPWTQLSVITLTVASTQESCQVDKYWYLPCHFTTTFLLMHLVGINQLLCLLWAPGVGTGPDLSLISNLLHISSRAQTQKIWGRSRGQRTRLAWPRGKGDREVQQGKVRQPDVSERRPQPSQTITAGDTSQCLMTAVSSLGC